MASHNSPSDEFHSPLSLDVQPTAAWLLSPHPWG